MSKISTYTVNPNPELSDKLIGTRVTGLPENNTMNYTLQAVLDLFIASGGSSLNIYNIDGTLNGNRFVTMGNYSLSFEKDLIVNTLTIGKGGGNIVSNTAFGQNSLYSNTIGVANTSIGYASMYSNVAGVDNTSIGMGSLFNNFDGIRNTSIGLGSLYSNISGSSNVSVGWNSMYWNDSGNYNTSIGVYSLHLNEFGDGNVSMGYKSLFESVTGSYNVSIGQESLGKNTVGDSNTSVGSFALNNNISGSFNVAIGNYSLISIETSSYNVAAGSQSLFNLFDGNQNVGIGVNSLYYLTYGSDNIGIGAGALFNLTDGNQNIGIGSNTTLYNDLDSNSIVIGYNAVGLGSNTIVFGNTSITTTILRGNIGIGTTTPSYILDVVGSDSRFNSVIVGKGYNDIAGNISIGDTRIGGVSLTNSGNYNLAIGSKVMRRLTTGRANASIGGESMQAVTTGSYNSAMGVQGLFSVTTGGYNSSLGYFANGLNTTGTYNVALGAYSATDYAGGLGLISGSYNIFLGASNYAGITTGSYNVIIGSQVTGLPSSTANNIVIADGQGNIRFRDNGVNTILSRLVGTGTRMVVANAAGELSTQAIVTGGVTGSGTTNYVPKWTSSSAIGNSLIFDDGTNVGIGTATPSQKLDVNGNIRGSYIVASNDLYGTNLRTNGFFANTITYMPFYSNVTPFGEIMRVQNDGNVLIGTQVSNGYRLQVNGAASIDNAYIGQVTGYGTTFASFSHYLRNGPGEYTLLSDQFGETMLNAKTGKNINFRINNINYGVLYASGNWGFGTTSDPSYKVEVNGTSRLNGQTTISGSTTASSAIAQGSIISSTLVAIANNDKLIGLDINPTYTNGAFTGINNIGLRLGTGTPSIYVNKNWAIYQTDSTFYNYFAGAVGIGANNLDFSTYKLCVSGGVYISGNTNTNSLSALSIATNELKPQYPNPTFTLVTASGTKSLTMYDSSGDIFIGTAPVQNGYKLTVGGISKFTSDLEITGFNDSLLPVDGGIKLYSNSTSQKSYIQAGKRAVIGYELNIGGVPIIFKNSTSDAEMARFLNSGNLLIGRTTEVNTSYKLQVEGNIYLNSAIIFKSSVSQFSIVTSPSVADFTINGPLGNMIYFSADAVGGITFANGPNVVLSGKVGIGTLNNYTLTYQLAVNGTTLLNNQVYVKNPGNNTCYIYMGDSTNNYTLIQFTNSASNFYTIGNKMGGSFSFTNSVGNQDVFSLSPDATSTLSIGGGNKANFSGRVGIGGWSNIYTLTNYLTVIGATSIGTTEALNVVNPTSVIFAVNSITQGSTPLPRMTNAQILAIASPISGLMVYNTTIEAPCFYDSTAAVPRWERLSHSAM